MNKESESLWKRMGAGRQYFILWLALAVAIFVILLIAMVLGSGGPGSIFESFTPVFFLVSNSLLFATAIVAVWVVGRWLLRWRNLRWILLGVGSLVGLVLLAYLEEDFRGWLTWTVFRHSWEAKGEHFSLASVVPPPVSDADNFALTPIVFTSYGAIMTREGKPIPEDQRDPDFAVRMRMPITLDYPGPTNCAGDRVKGTLTRLDRWQSHYRELASRTNVFPVPPQPGSPAADVLLALSKYDGVLEELRAACQLPCSRYPLNYSSERPWTIMLPHLAVLKSCSQLLQLRAIAHLQNAQPDQALEDVRLALQLTDKIHTEPILISHLVRLAMVQLMLQPVWEGLAEHKWSDAQLGALEAELAKLDFCADYKLGMRCELGFQSDLFKLMRRHPEQLRELEELRDLSGNKPDMHLPPGRLVHLIPAGWFYQDQYRSARVMEEYYVPLADVPQGTFSPDLAHRAEAATAAASQARSPFNALQRLLLPSLVSAAKRFAYGQASVNLARTALALERCRLAKGAYPDSLDALAPEFIAKVPHDVIGGQPLKYRRKPDGSYVLYSIGWNQKDDDGEPAFNPDGSVDFQNGDWVWHSAAKAE